MEEVTTLPPIRQPTFSHSISVCCGFFGSLSSMRLHPVHPLKTMSSCQPSITPAKEYDELFEVVGVHTVPGTCHPVRFYPGTSTPFIDLSGDDEVPDLDMQDMSRNRNLAHLGNPIVVEKVERGPIRIINDFGVADEAKARSIESRLNKLLPDTQLESLNSPTTSPINADHSLDKGSLGCSLTFCPTPTLSPQSHSNSTIDFESTLASQPIPQTVPQKLSCRERKRIIVPMNRPPNITKAMKAWIAKTHYLLDPFREDDECWFHPSPPSAGVATSGALRPCGKIQKCFTWQDHKGKYAIVLNFGIVSKLLLNRLTKQQKDGFISKRWHLSHLCGNWPCLNPAHATVEPGSVNISRNNCFSHRSGCAHTPQCLKDKKVPLGADGKLLDLTAQTEVEENQASAGHVDWDDWRHGFDDDHEFMVLDDVGDPKSLAPSIADDDISPPLYG